MKIIKSVLILIAVLVFSWFGLIMFASESGEVVVLHTQAASGETQSTRLWVVEHQGYSYLRSGNRESGWFRRIQNAQLVMVERNGRQQSYKPELAPELRETINKLITDKYGWAEKTIDFFLSRDDAVPVRLAPLS